MNVIDITTRPVEDTTPIGDDGVHHLYCSTCLRTPCGKKPPKGALRCYFAWQGHHNCECGALVCMTCSTIGGANGLMCPFCC